MLCRRSMNRGSFAETKSTRPPTANSEVVDYGVTRYSTYLWRIVISGAVVFAGTGLNRARLRFLSHNPQVRQIVHLA